METLIRIRKGDTCVVSCNNKLYYALAIENFIGTKPNDQSFYTYPEIFRFIYIKNVSDRNNWCFNSFKRRFEYDYLYSDHITGQYIGERVIPYPMNLLSMEIQKLINEFKTKFKL